MIITEEKYNEELTRYVLPFIRLNFEDGYMKSADGTHFDRTRSDFDHTT